MRVRSNSKFENSLFFLYLLNKNILVNIPCKFLKFGIHIHEYHSEGSLSQIVYLSPAFYFIETRIVFRKKHKKNSF